MKKRNTIGMDMGDRKHRICILDAEGEVVSRIEDASFGEVNAFLPEACVCVAHGADAENIQDHPEFEQGEKAKHHINPYKPVVGAGETMP